MQSSCSRDQFTWSRSTTPYKRACCCATVAILCNLCGIIAGSWRIVGHEEQTVSWKPLSVDLHWFYPGTARRLLLCPVNIIRVQASSTSGSLGVKKSEDSKGIRVISWHTVNSTENQSLRTLHVKFFWWNVVWFQTNLDNKLTIVY